MRGLFGLVGLLLSLAIVGVLVKQQLSSTQRIAPTLQLPQAAVEQGAASAATGSVREQSQQVQQQVQKAVEAAMQPARAEPDDK
jgi:hypothetical protein